MRISKLAKYPIAYLAILLLVYTVYDYIGHISRKDSIFEKHPWYWLLFSLSAFLSFIFIVLLSKHLAQKILNQNLIIEVIVIGIWLGLYITVLGPLFNKLFWPFSELRFSFKFGPFIILLCGYFVLRVVVNLVLKKPILFSK